MIIGYFISHFLMRMWMFLENVGNILAMDDVMQFMIQDCFSKKSSLKLVHT